MNQWNRSQTGISIFTVSIILIQFRVIYFYVLQVSELKIHL